MGKPKGGKDLVTCKHSALFAYLRQQTYSGLGQEANSQVGPDLETYVPSGQTFTSWVQATWSFVAGRERETVCSGIPRILCHKGILKCQPFEIQSFGGADSQ